MFDNNTLLYQLRPLLVASGAGAILSLIGAFVILIRQNAALRRDITEWEAYADAVEAWRDEVTASAPPPLPDPFTEGAQPAALDAAMLWRVTYLCRAKRI
jgi:hypothetical protein